jgi:DNA polymerase I-like protein with 3'-5' exonuclease and polymerase domains
VKISRSKQAKKSKSGEPQYFAAWICLTPGDLCGKYCNGDVIRTEKLYKLLMPDIIKRGMLKAYERERKLVPILLHIERQGIRVDVDRLAADVAMYEAIIEGIDKWIYRKLKDDTVNLDSGTQLVAALDKVGLIDLKKLGTTPKSKAEKPTYKSDKDSLNAAMTDMTLAGMIQYRSQLGTCLKTFMKPWLKTALASGGLIFTTWNQIRNDEFGARTGRFSSSPNFQNIPQEFKPIFKHDLGYLISITTDKEELEKLRAMVKTSPSAPFVLPKLPMVRSYVIPMFPDHILIDRDFSQQEPRIFAHFEDGPLKDAYNENPWLDLHDHAQELINDLLNAHFKRKPVKQINLGLLYGMGIALLAVKAEVEEHIARTLKNAVLTIFPGLEKLNTTMKKRAANDEPIYTWGEREYKCEPAKYIDGRVRTFDYKMINVLIQGSAADCTKEALIKLWEMLADHPDWYLLLTVHDEILLSVPSHEFEEAMEVLRIAMESPAFDVPMLSEGTVGLNWSEMKPFDKKGVLV